MVGPAGRVLIAATCLGRQIKTTVSGENWGILVIKFLSWLLQLRLAGILCSIHATFWNTLFEKGVRKTVLFKDDGSETIQTNLQKNAAFILACKCAIIYLCPD